MPLTSMTGFGAGQASSDAWRIEVELSSVNRRQFDCTFSLPRELAALEAQALAAVRRSIRRGYLRGVVRLHGAANADETSERAILRRRIAMLRQTAAELGLRDDLAASALLQLLPEGPGAPDAAAPQAQAIAPLLESAIARALDALATMRRTEGAALEADLRTRLRSLRGVLKQLRDRAPESVAEIRAAMLRRLQEVAPPFPPDDPCLLRELALLADRCDISEELTRLDSHLDQAEALLESSEPCGRTFDFLCQELFREINTAGSKASDALLARLVIRFKSELEAIREQIQNLE